TSSRVDGTLKRGAGGLPTGGAKPELATAPGGAVRTEDMIIVSADDHVVQPPDLFERHLPTRYRDLAPKIVHKDDGTDVCQFLEFEVPNIGLHAVAARPPEEYGLHPTPLHHIPPP